jgi:putative two-component system response regulator
MLHKTILVVDDEPRNLAALRQVLEPTYALVFARNGTDALELARRLSPALVLLDIEMPGMDGYAVCRSLKADTVTAGIPVIFISAHTDSASEEAGFEAGGVDFIAKPVSLPVVRARVRTHLSLVQYELLERSHRDAVFMLGEAGHFRDTDTGVHTRRMASYAAALARGCGWSHKQALLLELAAPLHDIGKLGIPDAILRKPGKLDAHEWQIMKTHSRIGHDILAKSEAPVFQLGAQIALRHHEKWDGSGYPDGLRGQDIPEAARIVALADVFDALTTMRPYKEAWPVERAVATLRESAGSHFEPILVDAFVAMLPQILEIKAQWDTHETAAATPPGDGAVQQEPELADRCSFLAPRRTTH